MLAGSLKEQGDSVDGKMGTAQARERAMYVLEGACGSPGTMGACRCPREWFLFHLFAPGVPRGAQSPERSSWEPSPLESLRRNLYLLRTHPFIHLRIHLPFILPFIHSSTHPYIYLPIHPSICLSIQPSICLSIHPSIHPSIHSSIHAPTQPFIHPSIHPSVHPSFHLPTQSIPPPI